jgi:enterochelin esterase-like enzyme
MGAVEDFVILGIYSGDRMVEYTKPGYELYARSLVEEVVPEVERRSVRTEPHRRFRSVWGSSLGGVVSFYRANPDPDPPGRLPLGARPRGAPHLGGLGPGH